VVPSGEVVWGVRWDGSCVAVLFRTTANAAILSSTEVGEGRLLIVRARILSGLSDL